MRRCILYFDGIIAMVPSKTIINREINKFYDEVYFMHPMTNLEVCLRRTKLDKYAKENVVYVQIS